MDISTIYGGTYSDYTQNTKKTTSETDSYDKTSEMSEAEEMAAFKKEFYADLEKLRINSSIVSVSINISEEAFKNMKADPEYRAKILSLLQRDLGAYYGSGARRACIMMTVGATLNDYRGDSWPICNASEYYSRSKNSFYKKDSGKKDRTEEVMQKYLEKRKQAKKLQEKLLNEEAAENKLEHSRLMKLWQNKRYMTHMSYSYDANVITQPIETDKFDSNM